MARYLTINSQFKPVSFDEMMKPALLYKAEYEKQQDAIDKLSENNTLEQLKNSSVDSNAYKAYENYKNQLQSAADELMNTGKLNYDAVRNIRRNYNQVIAPYEEKFENRAKKIGEQAKNYSINKIYSRDFSNVSLDDFTNDMTSKTLDLNEIYKDTVTKLLAKYQSGEVDDDANDEIADMYNNIDSSDFDDDKKAAILNAVIEGRNAAIGGFNEYLRKAENEKSAALAKQYQAQAAYNRAIRSDGSVSGGNTKKDEFTKKKITLKDGTTAIVKVDKDGKMYDKDTNEEITDVNKLSPANNGFKYAKTGIYASGGKDLATNKTKDGVFVGNKKGENSEKTYNDMFNDTPNKKTITSRDELLNFISENSNDAELLEALSSVLGVDKNGNIDAGWFVNNKKIEVVKAKTREESTSKKEKYEWLIRISTNTDKTKQSTEEKKPATSTEKKEDDVSKENKNATSNSTDTQTDSTFVNRQTGERYTIAPGVEDE